MTRLSAQSIRIGTTVLAAVSLAVSLALAARMTASPVQGGVPNASAPAIR
jgi:hypothetical protein